MATLLHGLDIPIRTITTDHAFYLRSIATVPYRHPGSAQLAEAAAAELTAGADVVLLRHHGCLVVADTADLALSRAVNLEAARRGHLPSSVARRRCSPSARRSSCGHVRRDESTRPSLWPACALGSDRSRHHLACHGDRGLELSAKYQLLCRKSGIWGPDDPLRRSDGRVVRNENQRLRKRLVVGAVAGGLALGIVAMLEGASSERVNGSVTSRQPEGRRADGASPLRRKPDDERVRAE